MDQKSFKKLKTTTVIIVVIQAIIDTLEYLLDPPFKGSGPFEWTYTTSSIILILVWSCLWTGIWVWVIIKENSCLVALLMVSQIIAVFFRLTLALFTLNNPGNRKVIYLVMHVCVALFSLITAGYLIVYYRKIRLVLSQGFVIEPNVNYNTNQPPQNVHFKVVHTSAVP